MKFLITALILFAQMALANESLSDEKKLAKLMQGKALACTPEENRTIDRADKYRGDDGFFKLSFKKKLLRITDNGGDGYGFANGGVNEVIVRGNKLFLEVGDDGHQTMIFDFSDIGGDSKYDDNCATGALVSFPPPGFLGEAAVLLCCLK